MKQIKTVEIIALMKKLYKNNCFQKPKMTKLAKRKKIPWKVLEHRAQYQVLVFPYYMKKNNRPLFALLKREDLHIWHGVGGGGKIGEALLDSVKKEAFEEAGIPHNSKFTQLSSITFIPVTAMAGFVWGPEVPVVPEYSFGVEVKSQNLRLSFEHTEYDWFSYKGARRRLHWESNKTSLWELYYRIKNNLLDKVVAFNHVLG